MDAVCSDIVSWNRICIIASVVLPVYPTLLWALYTWEFWITGWDWNSAWKHFTYNAAEAFGLWLLFDIMFSLSKNTEKGIFRRCQCACFGPSPFPQWINHCTTWHDWHSLIERQKLQLAHQSGATHRNSGVPAKPGSGSLGVASVLGRFYSCKPLIMGAWEEKPECSLYYFWEKC